MNVVFVVEIVLHVQIVQEHQMVMQYSSAPSVVRVSVVVQSIWYVIEKYLLVLKMMNVMYVMVIVLQKLQMQEIVYFALV